MTPTDPLPAPTGADAPIANFSQCHVGIIGHLDALGELPALMAPARRARKLAADMLHFFDAVILEHHAEEERELFPAVLQSAAAVQEHDARADHGRTADHRAPPDRGLVVAHQTPAQADRQGP